MWNNWQQRKKRAAPCMWLLLLLLVNAWMNADTIHYSTSSRHAYDDIDSITEWLVETATNDDELLPENSHDDQDQQSQKVQKLQWQKEIFFHEWVPVGFVTYFHNHLNHFRLNALSNGFVTPLFTPPIYS